MIKKITVLGGGLLLLLSLFLGRDAFSYVSTSVGWMKNSVRDSVPVEFEIKRARRMVAELQPEIRRNMHLIAKEEVEVESLEKQVRQLDQRLTKDETEIMQLKSHLDAGKDYFEHAGFRYSNAEVQTDLANRFERYKTNDLTLDNLRKVLLSRRQSLNAARNKLEQMLAAKRDLVVDVENLEARQKMVEVAQNASDVNFDDSQLARTKGLIRDIRTRIEVAERMVHVETNFHDGIQLDTPVAEDVADEVAEYFSHRVPGIEVLAESN